MTRQASVVQHPLQYCLESKLQLILQMHCIQSVPARHQCLSPRSQACLLSPLQPSSAVSSTPRARLDIIDVGWSSHRPEKIRDSLVGIIRSPGSRSEWNLRLHFLVRFSKKIKTHERPCFTLRGRMEMSRTEQ